MMDEPKGSRLAVSPVRRDELEGNSGTIQTKNVGRRMDLDHQEVYDNLGAPVRDYTPESFDPRNSYSQLSWVRGKVPRPLVHSRK